MHFYPSEIRHSERFREQRADVVEMRENAFGVSVAFAAENFVAVDGKPVEKILSLGGGFLNETWEPGFDRLQFPRMDFEVRMETDEVRKSAHGLKLGIASERVELASIYPSPAIVQDAKLDGLKPSSFQISTIDLLFRLKRPIAGKDNKQASYPRIMRHVRQSERRIKRRLRS